MAENNLEGSRDKLSVSLMAIPHINVTTTRYYDLLRGSTPSRAPTQGFNASEKSSPSSPTLKYYRKAVRKSFLAVAKASVNLLGSFPPA